MPAALAMIEPRRHKARKKHKEERKEDCSASLAIGFSQISQRTQIRLCASLKMIEPQRHKDREKHEEERKEDYCADACNIVGHE